MKKKIIGIFILALLITSYTISACTGFTASDFNDLSKTI